MKMERSSPSLASSPSSLIILIPMLLLFVLVICGQMPELAAKSVLPLNALQQKMDKRFYAWDEMSAKRSLIPPNRPDEIALGLLEESGEGEEGEDGDGQTPVAAAAALPVVLKRVPNSKLDEWKYSLRQRHPTMTRLFFGPTAIRTLAMGGGGI